MNQDQLAEHGLSIEELTDLDRELFGLSLEQSTDSPSEPHLSRTVAQYILPIIPLFLSITPYLSQPSQIFSTSPLFSDLLILASVGTLYISFQLLRTPLEENAGLFSILRLSYIPLVGVYFLVSIWDVQSNSLPAFLSIGVSPTPYWIVVLISAIAAFAGVLSTILAQRTP